MNTRAHRLYRSGMFLILFLIFFIFQNSMIFWTLKKTSPVCECMCMCAWTFGKLLCEWLHNPRGNNPSQLHFKEPRIPMDFSLGEHNVGDGRGLVWPKIVCIWAHRRFTKPSSDKRKISATLTTLYTELFLKLEMHVNSSKSIPQSM